MSTIHLGNKGYSRVVKTQDFILEASIIQWNIFF